MEDMKKLEEVFEVEGYDECTTTLHSCLHDCLFGGPTLSNVD